MARPELLSAVRLLARILPQVVLLVLIGALFWPTKEGEPLEDELDAVRKPYGPTHMPSALRSLMRRGGCIDGGEAICVLV